MEKEKTEITIYFIIVYFYVDLEKTHLSFILKGHI